MNLKKLLKYGENRNYDEVFYNQLQKLWEKLLFGRFRVSTPFPLLKALRNNEQNLRQAMLWVCNIV